MKSYLECIPCFISQSLNSAKLCGADRKTQKHIIDRACSLVPSFSLESTPPEISTLIFRMVTEILGDKDPYKKIKEESNRKALEIYPVMKKAAEEALDPLLTAVELAIAGNIIDYGAFTDVDLDKEITSILEQEGKEIEHESDRLFNIEGLRNSLDRAETVLYLGDNAGEIVFDRILVEEIAKKPSVKKIYFMVRDEPIINDILTDDFYQVGLDNTAEVITSGSGTAGVIIEQCSPKFRDIFYSADTVISKGQGNYESLSDIDREVFFLLRAKCAIVARDLGSSVGDIILLKKD